MRLFCSTQVSAALTLSVFLCSVGSVSAQSEIDRVIAIVNNQPIMLSEYRSRYRQERVEKDLPAFNGEVNGRVLDAIIDELLQVREADLRGIQVTNAEVESAVQIVASQNNLTVDALAQQLARDNIITIGQFRRRVAKQQKIRKLIGVVANSRVNISEQEVENFLTAHGNLKKSDDVFEVSHLFIQTKGKSEQDIQSDIENATYVRSLLVAGGNFAEAVSKFSDSGQQEGGYIGWRTVDQLPDLFIKSLRNMNPATESISEVLRSDGGLHILKLHNRRGSGGLVKQQLIRHILIQPDAENNLQESKAQADEIYAKLKAGEPFEKLARLFSEDPQSKRNGGELGWVNPGTLVPQFEKSANVLPLNTISQPVRTEFGFHIIEVLDRREVDMSAEIASNKARQEIFERKSREIYDTWFRSLKQQAYIEYVSNVVR